MNINISTHEGLYVAQVQKLVFDKLRYYSWISVYIKLSSRGPLRRFWNNLHHVRSYPKVWKFTQFKIFESKKSKSLMRVLMNDLYFFA